MFTGYNIRSLRIQKQLKLAALLTRHKLSSVGYLQLSLGMVSMHVWLVCILGEVKHLHVLLYMLAPLILNIKTLFWSSNSRKPSSALRIREELQSRADWCKSFFCLLQGLGLDPVAS